MRNPNRADANGPKTHAMVYGLFISIAVVIAVAILDAAGGSIVSFYSMVADALATVTTV